MLHRDAASAAISESETVWNVREVTTWTLNNNSITLLSSSFLSSNSTEAFPPLSLAPAIISQSIESGEGTPYPMLAVTGLLQSQLEASIKETNQFLEQSGKGAIGISLYNGLRAFVVTGPPTSLVGLVNNLKKHKAESGKDQSKVGFRAWHLV